MRGCYDRHDTPSYVASYNHHKIVLGRIVQNMCRRYHLKDEFALELDNLLFLAATRGKKEVELNSLTNTSPHDTVSDLRFRFRPFHVILDYLQT